MKGKNGKDRLDKNEKQKIFNLIGGLILAIFILSVVHFHPRWNFSFSMLFGFIVTLPLIPSWYVIKKTTKSKKNQNLELIFLLSVWGIIIYLIGWSGILKSGLINSEFLAGVILVNSILLITKAYL